MAARNQITGSNLSHQTSEVSAEALARNLEDAGKKTARYKDFKFCSKKLGVVLLFGGVLAIQDFTFEYAVMVPRKRVFNEDVMKSKFEGVHKSTLGRDAIVPAFGYPDMGAGYFSKRIAYKDWYEFNCYQRVHGNSLEHISWSLPLMFVSGIFQPVFTIAMQSVVICGRELYRFGYLSKDGPNSVIREIGAIPLNVAEIMLLIGFTSLWFRHRFSGALKNRKLIRKFTHSKQDVMLEKILKEDKDAKEGYFKIYRDQKSMLPMHPLIMGKKDLPKEKGLPGQINHKLPDIPSHF